LPKFAAFMVTTAEAFGGLGLLLGALTPLAAFAVIAALIDAWAVNVSAGTVSSEPVNVPFLVAVGATALLFMGSGAHLIDAKVSGPTGWSPRIAAANTGARDRRRDLAVDFAERNQPDPLRRSEQLEPTGG
jgi:putative oxidoreductase